MNPIDAYVAELEAVLHGPHRAKTDLLAEARDGLVDAAEAYEQRGLTPEAAHRQAVADFGEVRRIAPGYQAELGYAQSVRTALLVVLVLAPQDLIWDYTARSFTMDGSYAPSSLYLMLSGHMSWLGSAALAGSMLAVVGCGIGARYFGVRRTLVRVTGAFALVVAGVFAVAGSLLTVLGPAPLLSVAGLPWLTVVLLLPMAWVGTSGRRCLAAG